MKEAITKANSKEDYIKKWYNHFQNLLGKGPKVATELDEITPVMENLEISAELFTSDKYSEAKKSPIKEKAVGSDLFVPEVLKYCDLENIILGYNNKLLVAEKPDQCSESNMELPPKSGDLSLTDNFRGIALSSIEAKLVNRTILNRIRPKINLHLRHLNQNGF